jgi:hypothetical protein
MSFERKKIKRLWVNCGPQASAPWAGNAWHSGPKPQAKPGRPRGLGPFSPDIHRPVREAHRTDEEMAPRARGRHDDLILQRWVLGSHRKGVGDEGVIQRRRWSAGRGSGGRWLAPEVPVALHEEDDGEG